MSNSFEIIPVADRVTAEVQAAVGTKRVLTSEEIQAELDKEITFFEKSGDRIRALAILILNENNTQATKFNELQAAIAAATSLADLKTRAATVGNMPIRTGAQLKSAIRTLLQKD